MRTQPGDSVMYGINTRVSPFGGGQESKILLPPFEQSGEKKSPLLLEGDLGGYYFLEWL